jgi:hypothetical protein
MFGEVLIVSLCLGILLSILCRLGMCDTCKHSGAVLPFPSAPVGRGVDGIDAMA